MINSDIVVAFLYRAYCRKLLHKGILLEKSEDLSHTCGPGAHSLCQLRNTGPARPIESGKEPSQVPEDLFVDNVVASYVEAPRFVHRDWLAQELQSRLDSEAYTKKGNSSLGPILRYRVIMVLAVPGPKGLHRDGHRHR